MTHQTKAEGTPSHILAAANTCVSVKAQCMNCQVLFNISDMIEGGGQFTGGTWYTCKPCDEEEEAAIKRISEALKKFKEGG